MPYFACCYLVCDDAKKSLNSKGNNASNDYFIAMEILMYDNLHY